MVSSYVMSFAKAVMVTSITTILKGFRPLTDSTTLQVLAKMFAILMVTVKCIVVSTTCMAQPSISMKRLVFKLKTSSSALRTVAHVTSFQIQEISQLTVLRKILRTRLGITSIATVMPWQAFKLLTVSNITLTMKAVRLKDTLSLSITNVTSLMAIVVKLPVHALWRKTTSGTMSMAMVSWLKVLKSSMVITIISTMIIAKSRVPGPTAVTMMVTQVRP